MTLDDISLEIDKANTIAILTHENPDGDAMGSSLAMYLALKNCGKNPDVIIPEYSRTFKFLPGTENIKKESDIEKYDLAIALDVADIKRLNGFSQYFENAKTTISIDHHSINTMFADYNFVNPASPACAQILVFVLEYFKMEITKDIGMCLLTGIITDTGGFKYPGVTAETFEFAAWLLTTGVNVSDVYKRVLQIKTKSNFELSRIAMNRIEFLEDGKVTFTYMTKEDEKSVNAEEGAHDGIAEMARDIEGVEVSVFLRETDGGFKASLRSNEYINVADVALMFGGGGHTRAAGCKLQGSLDQIKQKIITEIKKVL